MARNYKDPPVIEAVCEIRVTSDTKWDLTVPGLIYEKVSNEFPIKEQRFVQEIDVTRGSQGTQQQIRLSERVLFLTNDRKMLIQVGQHLLTVNCLKPYPSWRRFRPRIEMAFSALANTVDVKGFQRIGLRYINRIEVRDESPRLEKYFEFRPFLGQRLPQQPDEYIVGCSFPFLDGRDVCRVQLTNAVADEPDRPAWLLDIDYFVAQPQIIEANHVLEWVDQAHTHVEEVFEGCITQRLRNTFQGSD
jgi:uncharacterized protein (TIGR04255 family)